MIRFEFWRFLWSIFSCSSFLLINCVNSLSKEFTFGHGQSNKVTFWNLNSSHWSLNNSSVLGVHSACSANLAHLNFVSDSKDRERYSQSLDGYFGSLNLHNVWTKFVIRGWNFEPTDYCFQQNSFDEFLFDRNWRQLWSWQFLLRISFKKNT